MRFVWGPIPEDPEFQPLADGWNSLREPEPIRMQFLAIPFMIVTVAVVAAAIAFGTPMSLRGVGDWFLLAFLVVIPIHELLHALTQPQFGLTRRTYLGVWPAKLVFYAHYEGELTRERFLFILAVPTIVLTVVPLTACVLFGWNAPFLAAVASANGVSAAGDLFGLFLISTQIPRGALVRNQGWRSYWRRR